MLCARSLSQYRHSLLSYRILSVFSSIPCPFTHWIFDRNATLSFWTFTRVFMVSSIWRYIHRHLHTSTVFFITLQNTFCFPAHIIVPAGTEAQLFVCHFEYFILACAINLESMLLTTDPSTNIVDKPHVSYSRPIPLEVWARLLTLDFLALPICIQVSADEALWKLHTLDNLAVVRVLCNLKRQWWRF
jgi:hypothetical protein